MKTRSFGERLDERSAQALFANHLRERYHYNPAMAEAISRDAPFVRTLLDPTAREDGQVVRYSPRPRKALASPCVTASTLFARLPRRWARSSRYLPPGSTRTAGRCSRERHGH